MKKLLGGKSSGAGEKKRQKGEFQIYALGSRQEKSTGSKIRLRKISSLSIGYANLCQTEVGDSLMSDRNLSLESK
ncbi:MAG: hypothetical protein P8Y63_14585 [Deltaproteobacteria bacterium]